MTKHWLAAWALLGIVIAAMPAGARQWKPAPAALALDYLQINHQKSPTEYVMVWWLAPPMFADSKPTQDVLEKYQVIGILDMHTDATGISTFEQTDVKVLDGAGKALAPVADADLPPGVAAVTTSLKTMLGQTLGKAGNGFHLFVYHADAVSACGPGHLSVVYGGETYNYDTPVPGCTPS
jgi:hypothetical protein